MIAFTNWIDGWQGGAIVALIFAVLTAIIVCLVIALLQRRDESWIRHSDLDAAHRTGQFSVGHDAKDRYL